ncbi:MAG: alpha/beta hydrolase [Myxococcota bacterium]|nr:alpha/beta hydrolase [Myxococcota bacterium]
MKLVFVHGSGGTGRVWRYQTEHFPGSLAVTLPGHPEGEPCETIEGATRWLRAQRAEDADARLVLVGHSLGGGIALQYALDHADELAGIVLVGSGARLRVHPATLAAMEKAVARPERFKSPFDDAYRKVAPDFAAELKELASKLGPAPFLADLRACDRFDVMDRLGEIAVPTLAIAGTEDVMTPPKYSEFLRDAVRDASVEIVEGGTHFVFAEYPDAVNAAIADFVAGLGGSIR